MGRTSLDDGVGVPVMEGLVVWVMVGVVGWEGLSTDPVVGMASTIGVQAPNHKIESCAINDTSSCLCFVPVDRVISRVFW